MRFITYHQINSRSPIPGAMLCEFDDSDPSGCSEVSTTSLLVWGGAMHNPVTDNIAMPEIKKPGDLSPCLSTSNVAIAGAVPPIKAWAML